MRPIHLGVLLGLAVGAHPPAPARAADAPLTLFAPSAADAAGPARLSDAGPLTVRVDRAVLARLRRAERARVSLPLPDRLVELELLPHAILAPGARVITTGPAGPRPLALDATVLAGEVAGEPGSIAVLTLSDRGVQGVVLGRDGRYTVTPARAGGADHAIARDAGRAPDAPPFRCGADRLPRLPDLAPRLPRSSVEAPQSPFPSPTRLVCTNMVDADYEYTHDKFGDDSVAAATYLLLVYATSSLVYERDLNVQLQINFLNLWTTSSDPWNQTNTEDQLTQFTGWCKDYRTGVSRNLAQLVSGRYLGGGIAWLHSLCNYNSGYSVFQWDANYAYPTPATTWDVMVTTHELGHNFGSEHTQSCTWQAIGLAPPGTLLDSCYTQEGSCYSGPTGIVPSVKGTIMSYCHLVGQGMNGIRVEFHDACKRVLRESAELSCLAPLAIQPPRRLAATAVSGGNALQWLPSPTPDVLRYRVYRATLPFDPNPTVVDSTLGTIYVDPNPGSWYYKVRAVRTTDESGWSNETRALSCTPSNPYLHSVGAGPLALLGGRFNADATGDLAVVNGDDASVSIVLGTPINSPLNNPFRQAVNVAVGTHPNSITSGDFNRDGALDLAVGIADSSAVTVLQGQTNSGQPTGVFAKSGTWIAGATPTAVATADVDEDGITDLVTALASGEVSVLRGLGSAGTGNATFAAPQFWSASLQPALGLAVADLNGDGILDLAVTDSAAVAVLLGQGTGGHGDGTFAAAVPHAAGAGARAIATGDFDDDGDVDLAVACPAAGTVAALLGDGSGAFAAAVGYPVTGGPTSVTGGDWNQDGLTDLATANTSGTTIAFLFGQGTAGVGDGTFAAPTYGSVGSTPRAAIGIEWNIDDRPDLAVLTGNGVGKVNAIPVTCAGPYGAAIEVTSPAGGEIWIAPSEHAITWTRDPAVPEVNIDVSRDGGTTWQTIAAHVTGTSWTWTVSEPYSNQAKIRVYDPTVPARLDVSTGTFTVVPEAALGVDPVAAPRLSIRRVEPTPSRGPLGVWLALPRPGRATLEVLDVAGRRVFTRAIGPLGPGVHRVDVTPGRELPSGIYLLRVTQDREIAQARAVLIR